MAKKWTPSLKQLSLYDELLKRQNITRKRLLKRRRIAEQEGSSFGRPLPDLVLPMKVKRHRNVTRYSKRFDSYADYREKIKALQNLYGGKGDPLLRYYKETYKKNITNIIKGWIVDILNYKLAPDGYFGRYSDEQIQMANQVAQDGGRFLELYNKMIGLSTGEFMTMYDSGFFPKLKYIYEEMKGVGGVEFSYVDEFLDSFSSFRRQAREQRNVFIKSYDDRRGYGKETYKHFVKLAEKNKNK